jgi:hypothetical protein
LEGNRVFSSFGDLPLLSQSRYNAPKIGINFKGIAPQISSLNENIWDLRQRKSNFVIERLNAVVIDRTVCLFCN